MFRALVFSAIVGIAFGTCPTIYTKPDFDYTQYAGDWFEIQRIENVFQYGMYCVRARYGATDIPGTVSVYNVATKPSGEFTYILGSASAPNASAPGSLLVEFPGQPDGNYWVLDTDYTTFSAVYSCEDYGGLTIEFAWLLSRTNTMSEEAIASAMENFSNFGIDTTTFKPFYHGDDCVYDEPTTEAPATA